MSKTNCLFIILPLSIGMAYCHAYGQISISALNTPVTQNFDALLSTGTGSQAGGIFAEGWSFLETGTNQNGTFQYSTGGTTTGDTYSFGVAGASGVDDRALGLLQSTNLQSIIGFKLTNNTGQTISSISVGYTGEVWRLSTTADRLLFSYQAGDVALNAATGWTTVPALEFTTPVTGSAAAVDGNNSSNRTIITPVMITGLYVQPGATMTFRWVDATASSSAGMGIDDFSVMLIPASSAWFRTVAGGNWNDSNIWETSSNGTTWAPATGVVPADAAAGITIASGHTVTITADLTVSRVVVKPGGKITYAGGSLAVTDKPGDDIVLEGTGSTLETTAATNPTLTGSATIRTGTGAVLRLSGNNNLLLYHGAAWSYADGAVFEYAGSSAPSVTGTFFSTQDGGAVPVFRYNSSGTAVLGGAGSTTINGKIEVAAGRSLNLSGVSGTLTVRNGITGAGDIKAGTILITGPAAEISGAGSINSNITIQSGCVTTLQSGKSLSNNNTLLVNGVLDAGNWQLQTVSGTATLSVGATGTVKTANTAGFVGTSGTVKAGSYTVNFAAGSTIDYNAAGNQLMTIAGIPPYQNLRISGAGTKTAQSGSNLVVQGSCVVAAGATMALSGAAADNLYLNNSAALLVQGGGIFDNGGESAITFLGGTPTVTVSGTFITRDQQGFTGPGTSLPSIVPVLNAGCTVEYGRLGDQSLQATITYENLVLSGSGTKTPSSALSFTGTLTSSGSVTLDGLNHSIGGLGNALVMTGTSRFLIGVTGTQPAMTGTYILAPATTIEFANTNTSTCTIRQGGSPDIQYANIVISGSNVSAPLSGITMQPGTGFTIKSGGVLKLSSPNGLYASAGAAILSANNPAVTLMAGSTVDYEGAAQMLTTGFPYSHLKISGTGTKTAPGPFTVGQSFTRSGTAALGGSSPVYMPGASLAYVDAAAGTTYTTGLEWPSVNTPANLTVNLSGSGLPAVILGSGKTVSGALNLVAGSLDLNGKSLSVGNGITGSGSLIGSSLSSLALDGGVSTISFVQTTDAVTNALGILTINAGNVTLANRLNIYTALDVAGGSFNIASQSFVLKSTGQQTARVAERKGTISGITNVMVERYIGTKSRRWRLLTAPVLNTSVNAAWQEGRKWDGTSVDNLSAGFGTLITGQQQGTAEAANAAGFDFWPAIKTGAASIRRYEGAASYRQAAWKPLTGTLFPGAFNNHEAYLLFVRGDRAASAGSGGATVLRAKGTLKEAASYTIPVSTVWSHTLVGNPFASPIDFKKIYDDPANVGTVQPYFWTWQALLGTAGGYVLVKPDGGGGYEAVPDGSTSFSSVSPVIASGEGFFVVPATTPLSSSLVIRQAHKTGNAPIQTELRQIATVGREQALPKLAINIYTDLDGTTTLMDGVLAEYGMPAAGKEGGNIGKAGNSGESLAIDKEGQLVAVASSLVMPHSGDTLQLHLSGTVPKNYRLQLLSKGFPAGSSTVLVDKYRSKEIPLALPGGITKYDFTITANEASRDPLRFLLVFRRSVADSPLPLVVSHLAALETARGAKVSWQAEGETDLLRYELEKSPDGQNFTIFDSVPAKGDQGVKTYERLDSAPYPHSFYRLRIKSRSAIDGYTGIVKLVLAAGGRGTVGIFPNPVTGHRISLRLIRKPQGNYTAALYSSGGKCLQRSTICHGGGTAVYTIPLAATIAAGAYTLEVKDQGNLSESIGLQVIR